MELSTKQVWRQEPIYRADIAKLAKALAEPASVHSSKNQNGYVCLSGEKSSWEMFQPVFSLWEDQGIQKTLEITKYRETNIGDWVILVVVIKKLVYVSGKTWLISIIYYS